MCMSVSTFHRKSDTDLCSLIFGHVCLFLFSQEIRIRLFFYLSKSDRIKHCCLILLFPPVWSTLTMLLDFFASDSCLICFFVLFALGVGALLAVPLLCPLLVPPSFWYRGVLLSWPISWCNMIQDDYQRFDSGWYANGLWWLNKENLLVSLQEWMLQQHYNR